MGIPRSKEWKKVDGYDYDKLIYEKRYLESGGFARIVINNPKKLNAFTGNMTICIYLRHRQMKSKNPHAAG